MSRRAWARLVSACRGEKRPCISYGVAWGRVLQCVPRKIKIMELWEQILSMMLMLLNRPSDMIPIMRLCNTTLYFQLRSSFFSTSRGKFEMESPSPFSPPSGAINIHPTRYTLSSTLSLILLNSTPILANSIRRSSRSQRYLLLSSARSPSSSSSDLRA